MGLRNPFRASFDPLTQNLWIGDVGQNAREEIDLMRPTDGGANFGWRVLEGTAPFGGQAQPGFTPPVAEYLHGTGPREGNSVTGGYVYRGPVEALRGQYIFADFVSGNLWSLPIASVNLGTTLAEQRLHPAQRRFRSERGRDRQCRELRRRPGGQSLHRRSRRRDLPDRGGVTRPARFASSLRHPDESQDP